ncbi:distal membrane-arm assembly complex protein 2-like [Pollicipes pollicipes]|uniref:distal membrane-arm assembly complex protein 2-like n=1 Tax=Pollicipes pollicipes TaxID=41117 RepID=UPI0018851977|nr:distal membrane-arm assembly complex protein 2-like [Pollicipes pollicipes]
MDEDEQRQSIDYYSIFELLRPAKSSTLEYFRELNAHALSRKAFHNFMENKIWENRVLDQRFLEDRHQILGFDLAAAHFVVARGGCVRFKGDEKWVKRLEDESIPLPGQYTYGMFVEELDASGTEILYEGLENFIRLSKLRALYLRDCPYVDDWCVDRVCGEFRQQLQHLDLSGCRRVSERGLEGVAQLKNLKSLTLERMDHIRLLPYMGLLLEDAIPGLVIHGVDVMQTPPDDFQSLSSSRSDDQSQPPSLTAS